LEFQGNSWDFTIFFFFSNPFNNLSRLNKGNHVRDSGWISDLNFLPFYFSIFYLVTNLSRKWRNKIVTIYATPCI